MNKLKGSAITIAVLVGALSVVALSQSEIGQQVTVSNFPTTYEVHGTVSVIGTINHSQYIKREGIVVTTSHRNELAELIPAGTLDATGFTSVTLSLQGEVKSSATADGTVGLLLLPDEEPVLRALREARRVEFPVETSCQLTRGTSAFFDSASITQPIGFARYKIFLYNTAPHAVEANIYVLLKN